MTEQGRTDAGYLELGRHRFPPTARLVMAIVNRTPDSFYDRGASWDESAAMDRVHAVVADGAEIVDIGGVKAAPGEEVSAAEEVRRTASFVADVRAAYPDLVISVDTWRHEVGKEVCAAGADLLNDSWGGWDERLVANEDYEFDYRLRKAGERLLLDPQIAIAWECRQSVPELWHQYLRYGRGKADVAVLHPASLQPRHLAAPLLVAWLAAAAAVAVRRPRAAVAMISPYLGSVAAASVVTSRGLRNRPDAVHLPGAFVAMHLAWGLGFWHGLATRAVPGRGGRKGS